jgi:hypothetical protein
MAKSSSLIPGIPNEWLALGAGAIVLWIIWKGGIAKAAGALTSTAAETAAQAAGGIVTGTATGVSEVIGLPTPADVTNDSRVARWVIDYPTTGGYFAASEWSSAPAFAEALFLPQGSGIAPPAGTKLAAKFPPLE